MSEQRIPDAESSRQQYAGSLYGQPTQTRPQYLNAPRQTVPALPQPSAALQQYATAASPYAASSGLYTTSRAQAAPQQGASYPTHYPTSVYAKAIAPKKRIYSRKRILIVSFEEHDFNKDALKQELHAITKLFVTGLGFEKPAACTITDSDDTPTEQLIDELTDFVESCRDTNELLVVYYSGHGGARNKRGGLIMANRGRDAEQTIYWNRIQKEVLFKVHADVFVILDCCFAEMGVKGLHQYRRDTIAACASDRVTEAPGNRSFTACMIQAANGLLLNGGFSVKQLCNEIERVASQKWIDGAARAERPIYNEQRGDKTEHEIYFERAAIPSNTHPSQSTARPQAAAVASRPPTSGRRAAPSSTQYAADEHSSSSEGSEDEDDNEDDDEDETVQARARTGAQTRGKDEAWQQHRVYARNAWSRMMAQGQTQSQAFDSLVRTWQAQMYLSSRDADTQIRRFLTG